MELTLIRSCSYIFALVLTLIPMLSASGNSADTLRLCFVGDVMMHSAQISNAARKDSTYDFSSNFELIRKEISRADISVANMEFTLAGKPYSGYPCFSAPDEILKQLADDGFDILLAANNHIYDKGAEGTARTLSMLQEAQEEHGMKFCGLAGSEEERSQTTPLIIKRKGLTIAIINFTYGTNAGAQSHWPKTNYEGSREYLENAFVRARGQGADIIIAMPHWGEEYVLRHSERQEATAKWLTNQGADLIIGTHPHVVQDFEVMRNETTGADVQVVYSLGNAVSNMSAANTQIELMASVEFIRDENGKIRILPMEFTYLWCSRPGGYRGTYTVLPVAEHIDRKAEWYGGWEHDKMMSTYRNVIKETGIKDRHKE